MLLQLAKKARELRSDQNQTTMVVDQEHLNTFGRRIDHQHGRLRRRLRRLGRLRLCRPSFAFAESLFDLSFPRRFCGAGQVLLLFVFGHCRLEGGAILEFDLRASGLEWPQRRSLVGARRADIRHPQVRLLDPTITGPNAAGVAEDRRRGANEIAGDVVGRQTAIVGHLTNPLAPSWGQGIKVERGRRCSIIAEEFFVKG
jgi:hypothetical protein